MLNMFLRHLNLLARVIMVHGSLGVVFSLLPLMGQGGKVRDAEGVVCKEVCPWFRLVFSFEKRCSCGEPSVFKLNLLVV